MESALPNNYASYTETELIQDSFFQDWLLQPTPEKEAFWQSFLLQHPAKKVAVENAVTFYKHLKFKEQLPDDEYINQQFLLHLEQVNGLTEAPVVPIKTTWFAGWIKIAVFIGGVVGLVTILLLLQPNKESVVVSTNYGQLKKVLLPDSTQIVLNANSQLTYNKSWSKKEAREVWLKGEAFFDVTHLNNNTAVKPHERFTVHTKDLLVEVLGTRFNIRLRRGNTEVVLQSGRVKVTLLNEANKQVVMKPGELLLYNTQTKTIETTTTLPDEYTAWKEGKLVLQNPTLEEIAIYLEDYYGKKIIIKDVKLNKKKIEGPIILNNLDDALFVISTVLNTDVNKEDSIITIAPRVAQ
jgi:transmembrane sensor